MANVFDIASYITHSINVDKLKLQKLLFYTQAVALVRFNKPAFSEKIEAWEYGPVIPEVYHKSKRHNVPIKIKRATNDQLETYVLQSADMVMKYFGEMAGMTLTVLSHSEKPWVDAYKKGRNTEITNKSIKAYYKNTFSFEKNEL